MEERLGDTSPSILKLYLNDDAGKGLREVGEALALGAKFKGAPNKLVIKINTTSMQHLKNQNVKSNAR